MRAHSFSSERALGVPGPGGSVAGFAPGMGVAGSRGPLLVHSGHSLGGWLVRSGRSLGPVLVHSGVSLGRFARLFFSEDSSGCVFGSLGRL